MRYWVKLYTEIVNDPKMGRLTDRQFRTCINLFALAGEIDRDGALPDVEDLAWRLRLQSADLMQDLAALAAVNILTETTDGWTVSKWNERQSKAPSAAKDKVLQRVHEHRERERNETVTTLHPEVKRDVTLPEKSRIDIEQKREEQIAQDDAEVTPEVRAINNAYDACGLMTSKTHQDVHLETIKRTGLPAWQLGFAEALKVGKHNIPKYVARCAESAMLAEQRGNGNGRTDTSRGFGLASLTTDADRAYHAANSPEAIAKLQAEWDAS